jgi:hypothetical protein
MKLTLTAKKFCKSTLVTIALAALVLPLNAFGGSPSLDEGAYREFGYLPMKDGVRLAYVIWLPQKAGRYPVVLHYSPYGSNAAPLREASRFLEAGYAFLGVNMRGTGCSEGVDLEDGSARATTVGRDGAEVVEWAAAQPWSTGRIGMIGNSYAVHAAPFTATPPCGSRRTFTLGFEVRGDFVSQLLASSNRGGWVRDVAVSIVQKPTFVVSLL